MTPPKTTITGHPKTRQWYDYLNESLLEGLRLSSGDHRLVPPFLWKAVIQAAEFGLKCWLAQKAADPPATDQDPQEDAA